MNSFDNWPFLLKLLFAVVVMTVGYVLRDLTVHHRYTVYRRNGEWGG